MAALKITPSTLFTLLALVEGPTHGYALLEEVRRRSRGRVQLGPSSLYYALGRLEKEGLIQEQADVEAPEEDAHAHQRRYFALTPAGHRRLEQELDLVSDLVAQATAMGMEFRG